MLTITVVVSIIMIASVVRQILARVKDSNVPRETIAYSDYDMKAFNEQRREQMRAARARQ